MLTRRSPDYRNYNKAPKGVPFLFLKKEQLGTHTMNLHTHGIIGLLVLVADIYALISIVNSGASAGEKILWCLLVILLPVIGLILWFFLGPRGKAAP